MHSRTPSHHLRWSWGWCERAGRVRDVAWRKLLNVWRLLTLSGPDRSDPDWFWNWLGRTRCRYLIQPTKRIRNPRLRIWGSQSAAVAADMLLVFSIWTYLMVVDDVVAMSKFKVPRKYWEHTALSQTTTEDRPGGRMTYMSFWNSQGGPRSQRSFGDQHFLRVT